MDDGGNSHSQQHLANQRIFLAWLRTCVGLFLVPIFTGGDPSIYTSNLVTAFESSTHYSSIIGTSMVVLGIVFTLFALRNYIYTYKSIEQGVYSPKHIDIYLLSIALVILGAFIVAYLVIIPSLIGQ